MVKQLHRNCFTMPVIIRALDEEQAIIEMVDSGIQREEILPSEKAAAYKMKLEAIKRQGVQSDRTSRQVVGKSGDGEKKEAADKEGRPKPWQRKKKPKLPLRMSDYQEMMNRLANRTPSIFISTLPATTIPRSKPFPRKDTLEDKMKRLMREDVKAENF